MARYERVAQIYELLTAAAQPLSLQSLCLSLDASTATIKRLVRFMREELQVPVEFDRAAGGYRLDRGGGVPPAIAGRPLEPDAALGLLAGCDLLEQLTPGPLADDVRVLRERLAPLPTDAQARRAALGSRLRVRLPHRRRVDGARFHATVLALMSVRRLRIRYRSRSRDGETDRVVSPQRLTFYRSNWYLAAWCHASGELRVFAMDRVDLAEALPIPAEVIGEFLLESRLESGYGIYAGEADAIAVLHFSADAARWVGDEQWHPLQRLDALPDGSVMLYVPYRHATELRADILRWGAAVEVMSPAELRRDVAAALDAAARRYG